MPALCPPICGTLCVHQGSKTRVTVPDGWFSQPEGDNATLRYNQSWCPLGCYCTGGIRQACPAGSYGDQQGLSSRSCSGECDSGYYCDAASSSRQQHPCGSAAVFCTPGSSAPTIADTGVYTIGLSIETRNATAPCHAGNYCVNGTEYQCPAGWFGCATGLRSSNCSGLCAPGYYCPIGSASNNEFACGNASVYCPEGSSVPLPVGIGNYSTGGATAAAASMQAPCTVGSYCQDGQRVSGRVHVCRGMSCYERD